MKRSSPLRILLSMVLNRPKTPALLPAAHTSTQPQLPLPDDRDGWIAHWKELGQPWRTEPEIDSNRQKRLDACRAILPDIEKGIFPFKGMKLSRADVEWLLATHEDGCGPVDWSDESQRERLGLDLRGADLQKTDLSDLPLARTLGGLIFRPRHLAATEKRDTAGVHLEGANLRRTFLEGSELRGAHMEKADLGDKAHLMKAQLDRAHLEEANLREVELQGANLLRAHLEEAYLSQGHLEGADLRGTHLEGTILYMAHLEMADLRNAFFNAKTNLEGIVLGNVKDGFVRLAGAHWGDVDLSVVNWTQIPVLGDEHIARQKKQNGQLKVNIRRLAEYATAVRAYRQLAVALQSQGLNEDAARFAYRAQVLQRKLLWKQRSFWKWFGSATLALLAGYGYRMWRIIAAYLIIISACALTYFILGIYFSPHISLSQAFLESMMAFHGRVFYELFNPGEPQIWITAFEAVMGLIIEGVFIAMLAQRFFGK